MPTKLALLPPPERYSLPGKPSAAPASVMDCHRQTVFLLAEELDCFAALMDLHLVVAAARNKPTSAADAAILTYASRTYALLTDSCRLLTCGAYGSCLSLLRSAIDCIAVRRALAAGDADEYAGWFDGGVSRQDAATAIAIGRYRASGPMVADDRLGSAYRAISDLGMTHFGANLLLAAPEADAVKVSISFGEASFHLGWAELVSGWLIELAGASIGQFTVTDEATRARIDAAISASEAVQRERPRCHVVESEGRWVLQNYRRNNRGQPRRVILG